MSLKMYEYHVQFIMYCLLYVLITHIKTIDAALNLDHEAIWLDDFALDATGQNGWNIQKISNFDLPQNVDNPIVNIHNIPTYHGPFPATYRLKRSITCNTSGDTTFIISWLPSYCNTEGKGNEMDQMQLHLNDHSETYPVTTFEPFPLTDRTKPFNATLLPYIQTTTAAYYTDHPSSSTNIPQCAQSTGTWYTSSKHNTFYAPIVGGHEYEIAIEMQMSGETDEYILISDVFAACYQLSFPPETTIAPSITPSASPTIAPSITPSASPTTTPSPIHPPFPAITPTTEQPTQAPETVIETEQPTQTTDVEDTTDATTTYTEEVLTAYTEAPVVRKDPVEEPWCQHCALYVLAGCVALVICFMILMFGACVMYKKENKKIKERKTKMKDEVKADHDQVKNASDESSKIGVNVNGIQETVNHDSRDIETFSDRTSQRESRSIVSDVNVMEYDEEAAQHPDHKKTISGRRVMDDVEEEDESEEDEDFEDHTRGMMIKPDEYGVENETESDDYDDISGLGVDGMVDGEEETNPHFMNVPLGMVNNWSDEHLNMDEEYSIHSSNSP
eukprot:84867_1